VGLAEKLARVRRPGLTFAPEAAAQRLRDVINKQVTEQDLFEALEAAFDSGWSGVKLYFMLGLPTETREDVEAIADLLERIVTLGRGKLGPHKGRLRISVSLGNFIPKAHTPFQWLGQESVESLGAKQSLLRSRVKSKNVRLSWNDVGMSRLEAAIARGDRRLGEALYSAWKAGARFDAWAECFQPVLWQQAFESAGLEWNDYAGRQIEPEAALPWEHLDYGVTKEFLRREAEAALSGRLTADCRVSDCAECGACPRGK
jgi:radical SAM superfamily enzyme YgiQ (UPF0313 family)